MTDAAPGALVKWGDFPNAGTGLTPPSSLVLAISSDGECASIVKLSYDTARFLTCVTTDVIRSDSVCINSDELLYDPDAA